MLLMAERLLLIVIWHDHLRLLSQRLRGDWDNVTCKYARSQARLGTMAAFTYNIHEEDQWLVFV